MGRAKARPYKMRSEKADPCLRQAGLTAVRDNLRARFTAGKARDRVRDDNLLVFRALRKQSEGRQHGLQIVLAGKIIRDIHSIPLDEHGASAGKNTVSASRLTPNLFGMGVIMGDFDGTLESIRPKGHILQMISAKRCGLDLQPFFQCPGN